VAGREEWTIKARRQWFLARRLMRLILGMIICVERNLARRARRFMKITKDGLRQFAQ
jgi:hypothetical protein